MSVASDDSRFAGAFVNRCVAYQDKGQADLAIKDCSAAIALNPNDAVAYNDGGVAYEKAGNVDSALADSAKAIELDPSYRDAFANRAVLYDHKGEKERAIADYRAALAKSPSEQDRKDLEGGLQRLGAGPCFASKELVFSYCSRARPYSGRTGSGIMAASLGGDRHEHQKGNCGVRRNFCSCADRLRRCRHLRDGKRGDLDR
jgi:tetratricopeptide (TPR) repeat protein